MVRLSWLALDVWPSFMQTSMIRREHRLQVVWGIIFFVAVQVMGDLFWFQRSTKLLLKYNIGSLNVAIFHRTMVFRNPDVPIALITLG